MTHTLHRLFLLLLAALSVQLVACDFFALHEGEEDDNGWPEPVGEFWDDDDDVEFGSASFAIVGQSTDSAATGDIVTLYTVSADDADVEWYSASDFLVCSDPSSSPDDGSFMLEHDVIDFEPDVDPQDLDIDPRQGGQLDLGQTTGPVSAVSFQLNPGAASGETLFISPSVSNQYFDLGIETN
mgnify:CR=1 FL=1